MQRTWREWLAGLWRRVSVWWWLTYANIRGRLDRYVDAVKLSSKTVDALNVYLTDKNAAEAANTAWDAAADEVDAAQKVLDGKQTIEAGLAVQNSEAQKKMDASLDTLIDCVKRDRGSMLPGRIDTPNPGEPVLVAEDTTPL